MDIGKLENKWHQMNNERALLKLEINTNRSLSNLKFQQLLKKRQDVTNDMKRLSTLRERILKIEKIKKRLC